MRLFTREWGDGDRLAVLVHGTTSDGATWGRVAEQLVARGYRVTAIDLRGHGQSPRGEYSPAAWASDLLETIAPGADLAIGHSLGGIVLWLAVDGLQPRRAVYVDPGWLISHEGRDATLDGFRAQKCWSREQIAAANPRWPAADVEAKHAALQLWDPDVVEGLRTGDSDLDFTPTVHPSCPSLVMLADPSELVPPDRAQRLRQLGFTVETVAGAGHSIHRDDLDGFLRCLDAWLARPATG